MAEQVKLLPICFMQFGGKGKSIKVNQRDRKSFEMRGYTWVRDIGGEPIAVAASSTATPDADVVLQERIKEVDANYTAEQLKEELEERGVEHPASANKGKLIALFIEDEDEDAEAEIED